MHAAARSGRGDAIEAFLRMGSLALDTPNSFNGLTPMHVAAANGHREVIETLVRLGSKALDALSRDGRKPLYCIRRTYADCATVLKALGAEQGSNGDIWKGLSFRHGEVAENQILDVRYRVYFAATLAHRLLFELDRSTGIQIIESDDLVEPTRPSDGLIRKTSNKCTIT